MEQLTFTFSTLVEESQAIYQSGFVKIPEEIASTFTASKVKRVVGKIENQPFRLAIHYSKQEDYYFLLVGKEFRKQAGISINQEVQIEIQPDPNPNAIDIPEEWQEYLNQDEEARAVWDTFTIGMKRSLVMYVSTAKTVETRIKRSIELGIKLKNRDLHYFKNQ